jgi:hypothetical protein
MSDYKSAFEAVKVALSKEEDALKQGEIEEIKPPKNDAPNNKYTLV